MPRLAAFLGLCVCLPLAACAEPPQRSHQQEHTPVATSAAAVAGSAALVSPPAAASVGPGARPSGPSGFEATWSEGVVYPEPKRPWRKLRGVNWRADSAGLPPLPAEIEHDAGACRAGMLPVKGGFLLDRAGHDDTDGVQLEQNAVCTTWRTNDKGINGLCDTFDRDAWLARTREFPRQPIDVCVDRYEFPNRYGEYPLVVTTYAEAAGYCAREGKRLCTDSEWTFACEGEEGMPYPYGYTRDATKCALDRYGPAPGRDTFRPRMTAETAKGLDLSWLAARSGEVATCTSPFGVGDLTGNVDEWTKTVRRYGYEMIMKGGHWGPARQRCRPQTRGHGPMYVRYDQGFRCCTEPSR